MRLGKLTIRTLPGIDQQFTVEPRSPGVNLVVGPNASGKSSLVRALKYLLGSRNDDPPALSLEAEFEDGETRWEVIRSGSQIDWRRNGAAASRPTLPGTEQIGLYRLSVESLLDHADASDRKLAERLRRELLGDCDLDALRAEAEPATRQAFGRREQRALVDAVKNRRDIENKYAALQREEVTLPDLQRRVDEARTARVRRERLEQASTLADAIEARRERKEQLGRFPPEMARLQGDERERLDELEKKARGLREELRTAQAALESAAAELERTGLAQAAPPLEQRQAIDAKLQELSELEAGRKHARAEVAKAQAAEQDARAHLGGGGEPPRVDDEACRRAEQLASDWTGATTRLSELQVQLKVAGDAPDAQHIDRLRDGAQALRGWLAASDAQTEPDDRRPRWPLLAAGGGALAACAAAGWALAVQDAPAALAAAVAAVLGAAVAVSLWRAARGGAVHPERTADGKRGFRRTGLDPPQRWDEPSVSVRLREVEDEWDGLRLRQKRTEGVARLQADIEQVETGLEAMEAKKNDMAHEIGFDPTLPAVSFDRFLRLCADWDKERKQHAEQTARVANFEQRIADTARGVREFLDTWPAAGGGGDPAGATGGGGDTDAAADPPDLDLLRSTFKHLSDRITAADEARGAIREARIESRERDLNEAEEGARRRYTAAGVEPGDRAALTARLEQWPDWQQAKKALDEAVTEERLAREALNDQPDLIALAEAGDRTKLQTEHDAANHKAAAHTALIQEQQDIRTRLEAAGRDRRLEVAATAEDRARQALEDRRDEALLAEATTLLVGNVEQAFKTEHEPEILHRARTIFADVTACAFDLHLRADRTFAARDVNQEAERSLDELSSGTRMQLLLALRLAWTEAQEQGGATLPLFLDEALTTSDEARFKVMAQSLERIAGTGDGSERQIFYLSARRHETALWRQATGSEPAVIDLAATRLGAGVAAPETYRVEMPPPVPAPEDGKRAADYASRLDVPRCDPRRSPGAIHLFHLLRDDLPLLHALMDTWRITALGQLEGLLESDAVHAAVPGEDVRERLRQRCRAVHFWTELWRVGRGRPVDRGVLEQCADAVSDRFINEVSALAERQAGDGAALVAALNAGEVRYFHASKADLLEQWLADNGYVDDRERLTAADRRRLTLQRVAPATEADARDVNQVVNWLEAAVVWLEAAAKTRG